MAAMLRRLLAMLRILPRLGRRLLAHLRRRLLLALFRRELQEDLFEAQPHRPHLEQAPAPPDHGARDIAPHVAIRLGVDLVADEPLVAIDDRDFLHAWK